MGKWFEVAKYYLTKGGKIDPEVVDTKGSIVNGIAGMYSILGERLEARITLNNDNRFLDTASGNSLKVLGADLYNLSYKEASFARTTMSITKASAGTKLVIPKDTVVRDEASTTKLTLDSPVVFELGETGIKYVAATAISAGPVTAVAIGSINQIEGFSNSVAVSNTELVAGGNNAESEASYRARCRNQYASYAKATPEAIRNAVLAVDEVRVAAVESTNVAAHFLVFAADETGTYNSLSVDAVDAAIHSVAAAGTTWEILNHTITYINVSVTTVWEPGAATQHNKYLLQNVIVNKFKELDANLGTPESPSANCVFNPAILEELPKTFTGLVSLTVGIPAAKVVPEYGQLLRAGVVTVF